VSRKQAIYLSISGVKEPYPVVSGMLFSSVFHFQSSWLLLKQSCALGARDGRTGAQITCCNAIPSAIFLKGAARPDSNRINVQVHWGFRLVEGNVLKETHKVQRKYSLCWTRRNAGQEEGKE
jgi:hypothetical protein